MHAVPVVAAFTALQGLAGMGMPIAAGGSMRRSGTLSRSISMARNTILPRHVGSVPRPAGGPWIEPPGSQGAPNTNMLLSAELLQAYSSGAAAVTSRPVFEHTLWALGQLVPLAAGGAPAGGLSSHQRNALIEVCVCVLCV